MRCGFTEMFEYGPKNEKSIYVQGMCVIAKIYFLICKHQQTITKEYNVWISWAIETFVFYVNLLQNILACYLIYRSIQ